MEMVKGGASESGPKEEKDEEEPAARPEEEPAAHPEEEPAAHPEEPAAHPEEDPDPDPEEEKYTINELEKVIINNFTEIKVNKVYRGYSQLPSEKELVTKFEVEQKMYNPPDVILSRKPPAGAIHLDLKRSGEIDPLETGSNVLKRSLSMGEILSPKRPKNVEPNVLKRSSSMVLPVPGLPVRGASTENVLQYVEMLQNPEIINLSKRPKTTGPNDLSLEVKSN